MNKFELSIDELHEDLYSKLEDIPGFCHKGVVDGAYGSPYEAAKDIAMDLIPLIESHLKPVQD